MPKPKKKLAGIFKTNKEKHEEKLTLKQKATRFVFSVLYTGLGYSAACLLFLFNDIVPPWNKLFYECQKEVVQVLVDLAKQSVAIEAGKIVPGSNVSIDGSWTQRRN